MSFQLFAFIVLTSFVASRSLRITKHTESLAFNAAYQGKDLREWRQQVRAPRKKLRKKLIANAGGQTASWVANWVGKLAPQAKPVGKGAFGKVYIATVPCDGSKVAVKQMKARRKDVEVEATVLKAFTGYPEFISYFDHGRGNDRRYYIMMEAALGGTLGKIIDGLNPSSKQDKMQLFFDMLKGVGRMHAQKIVHRDLKPANVFISRTCGRGSTPCHAKVGDLGLACVMRGSSVAGMATCKGIGGTPLYIAPETYKSSIVDPKNDVWAMGLMLYELVFGHLPTKITKSRSLQELERKVKSFSIAADTDYKRISKGTSLKKLLGGMLAKNYKRRISALDALELAYDLLDELHVDVIGGLPDCFFGEGQLKPPENKDPIDQLDIQPDDKDNDEEEESHESLDDVDFFTIHQAMTNIATSFMFNAGIIDPKTGIVVASNAQLGNLRKSGYLKAPLQHGFKILEVNDKAYTSLTYDDIEMIKKGILGSSLTFKFAKN